MNIPYSLHNFKYMDNDVWRSLNNAHATFAVISAE